MTCERPGSRLSSARSRDDSAATPAPSGQAGTDAAIEQARNVLASRHSILRPAVDFPRPTHLHQSQSGERELREMYKALNQGPLAFREPFLTTRTLRWPGLSPDRVQSLMRWPGKRWAAFPFAPPRAERACFVQSTIECTRVDLVGSVWRRHRRVAADSAELPGSFTSCSNNPICSLNFLGAAG
jgi:hypothetical protein